MSQDIKILSEKTLADAWGKLSETRLEMRRRDGTWQEVSREVYDHGSAAAVLLCDPAAGNIILTRQFRYPPFRNGDPGWLIEACAGLLDGDTPEACAALLRWAGLAVARTVDYPALREASLERLADTLASSLDLDKVFGAIG